MKEIKEVRAQIIDNFFDVSYYWIFKGNIQEGPRDYTSFKRSPFTNVNKISWTE